MKTSRLFLAGALLLGAVACQDMDVTNPNNPNRESVLQSPADVQALVSPTFRLFFNQAEGDDVTIPMSFMADEFSGAFFDFGGLETSQEPRATFNPRSPNSNHSQVWQVYYSIIAAINTAFRAIDQGNLVIREGGADVTARLRTFGKFMQGLAHGQAALAFVVAVGEGRQGGHDERGSESHCEERLVHEVLLGDRGGCLIAPERKC